ncbi:MAG: efflux RND transporter periplasmic adaptor subunit [Armatimonadetes bacterium]|nr:efflux RND transporter periplasmic adaptor subunit [Armatimonadota bacterium]
MRRWFWMVLAIVAVVAIAYQLAKQREPVEVTVAQVERRDIVSDFAASGVFKGNSTSVYSQVAGIAAAVHAREGQTVQAGAKLVTIDAKDIEAERARVVQAAAAIERRLALAVHALEAAESEHTARLAASRRALAVAIAERTRVMAGPQSQLIQQARDRLEQATAARDLSKIELARAETLYNQQAAPRSLVDAALSRLRADEAEVRASLSAIELLESQPTKEEVETANARVRAAEAEVEIAQALGRGLAVRRAEVSVARAELGAANAAVRQVEARFQDYSIAAPVAGVVAKLDLRRGEAVSPAHPVAVLSTEDEKYLEIEVSDQDIAKIAVGDAVNVTSGAQPGRRYQGRIYHLATEAELKPDAAVRVRILRARVRVDDPEGFFRIGMEADVEGEAATVKAALTVPSDSVVVGEEGACVWVVVAEKVERRPVKLGFVTFAHTEVLEGLQEGEKIVVRGKEGLETGQRVKVAGSQP